MTHSVWPSGHVTAPASLRRRAEEAVLDEADSTAQEAEALSPEAMLRTLHELRVHQIELEMQNDELRRAQAAIDASLVRYFDHFDMAPAGYFSVSHQGLILEANFAAADLLGRARGALIGQAFTRFIFSEDQDAYYLLGKRIAATGHTQSRELRLLKADGTTTLVRLVVALAIDRNPAGAPGLRIVLVELSDRG